MNQGLSGFRRADKRFAASGFAGGEYQLFALNSLKIMRLSVGTSGNRRIIAAIPRHADCFNATHLHKRGDRFLFTLPVAA